jgi:hypothetical protein
MIRGCFTRFRNAFAIDLEVLAIFRLLLALIVIWGLVGRVQIRDYLFPFESTGPKSLSQKGSDPLEASRSFNQFTRLAGEGQTPFGIGPKLELEKPSEEGSVLYSSRESRSVWTPWHWSLLWLDQVVEESQATLLSVHPVPRSSDVDKETTEPAVPVLQAWQQPLQSLSGFLASRMWFDGVVGLGIASAILFGLGLFTKTSNFLLWVVVVSVQHRMPLFNSGADSLERLFLFWMLFLPSGAMFSLDAWWFSRQGFWRKRINQARSVRFQNHLNSGEPMLRGHAICNWATAALLLQLIAIYFYSALEKWNADWWSGTAVESALQWSFITKPLAATWLTQPGLLRVVTWSVLGMELLCPLLVFCPGVFGWTRRATATFFLLMHVGIAATLTIGTFSAICAAGWLLFWAWPTRPNGGRSRWWWCDQRDQSAELASLIPSSSRASATAAEWLVVLLMSLMMGWNLSQASLLSGWIQFPRALHPVLCQFGLDPNFPMFGRVPQGNFGWAHRVDLASGDSFDLRPELPVPLNVPNRIDGVFEPHAVYLWRQLHVNLLYLESQQSEFVQLVRQRLYELEFRTWQAQARANGRLSAQEIDSARSVLLMVDQDLDDHETGTEERWGFTKDAL